jgi:hypothetical protein
MIDIDCDDHDIHHAMRRATRIRWVNSRTVPYVAHLADDCAPGLEMAANASLCWDRDHDRPSPGDDITHAAFDELDRER